MSTPEIQLAEVTTTQDQREQTPFRGVIFNGKRFLGRAALMLGLVAGPTIAVTAEDTASRTQYAEATTEFTNDYPNLSAATYNLSTYDWWVDENGNGKPDVTASPTDDDETMSSRGYNYRNCTDGVAYWTAKYTGVGVRGWGNANTWDTGATLANYIVKSGNTNSIEPGDIAQSDDGSYGHVGFVTGVSKNTSGAVVSITVAELNRAGTGEYSINGYSSRNVNGNFSRGVSSDWDHFIDVNGPNKGLGNEDLGGGSISSGPTRPVNGDFNGDRVTDPTVFRPSDGWWHSRGVGDVQWGRPGDIPVPADYNGDKITDYAIYRPENGGWYLRGIGDFPYGWDGDIPVPGDYNGDGAAEMAVYRPTDSMWHIRGVGDFQWGRPGDIPVPGYYNNDNYMDIAIYRPENGGWYIRGVGDFPYGWSTDIPIPADYNGDGITDMAVYRQVEGGWHLRGVGDFGYGWSTDIPLPGYYNNDKIADAGVYRRSEGGWHLRGVGDFGYGWGTDIPAVQTLNAFLLKQYGLIPNY